MSTAHSSFRTGASGKWLPPPQGEWTHDDYAQLPENGYRYEVIDGNLYITPSPNWFHQEAVSELAYLFREHLHRTGSGKALVALSDVRLKDIGSPGSAGCVCRPERQPVHAEGRRASGWCARHRR